MDSDGVRIQENLGRMLQSVIGSTDVGERAEGLPDAFLRPDHYIDRGSAAAYDLDSVLITDAASDHFDRDHDCPRSSDDYLSDRYCDSD